MKTNSFDKKKDKKKPATGSTASHPHKSDEPNERSTGASVLTALRFRVYFELNPKSWTLLEVI